MKSNWLRFVVSTAFVFPVAASSAATLTMIARPVARFSDNFDPLPFNNTRDPGIYQVDFAIAISNLQPGERGFGGLGFDVTLTNLTDTIGWQGDTSTVDSNGATPGGIVLKYSLNVDAGPSPTDLQRITVAIQSGLTNDIDPRTHIARPGPDYIGSLFLKYNGVGFGTIGVHNFGFLTTDANGHLSTIEQPGLFPSMCFSCFDPPDIIPRKLGGTSLDIIDANLFAFGGPVVWSELEPAEGTPALAATLTPEGHFQWHTAGSARGPRGNGVLYSWRATATKDGIVRDRDIAISLRLEFVPEPAALALLAWPTIGSYVNARRRHVYSQARVRMASC